MNSALFNLFLDMFNVARFSMSGSTPTGLVNPITGAAATGTPVYATLAELEAACPAASNSNLVGIAGNKLYLSNGTYYEQVSRDKNAAASIMWLGDSKTSQSVPYASPLVTDKSQPVYKPATSLLTNVNASGTFVSSITIDYEATAGAGAVLSYTKSTRTLTWTAPGDSAGTPVDVSAGGWFRLESATANKGARVAVIIRNEPASDKSDTFSYAGYNPSVDYTCVNSVPAMWNALNQNPFGENQYFYAIDGATSSDMLAITSWKGVYTDVTHIDITTNGISSKSAADQTYSDVINIITLRRAVGSRVILAITNLDNLDYSLNVSTPKWKAYLAAKLQDYCIANNVESYAPAEFLNTGNSLSAPNVTANFNTDTVHYSQRGAYLIAKYLLDPILSKYVPKMARVNNPLVAYDATNSPNGNLLNNIAFGTTTGGTAGTGASGSIPGSWTLARTSGSVMTAVGSYVARSDKKYGNVYRITLDNTGGAANETVWLYQSAAISNSNLTAGDKVILSGELFVAGTGITGVKMYLNGATGGRVYAIDYGSSGTDLGEAAGETVHYQLCSMPFTIQSGFNGFVLRLEMLMAANGVATFDVVPNLCVRKVA